jgi:mono/diheme cytochrome c family protein
MRCGAIAITALIALTSQVSAQEFGNVKKGAALAQVSCAQCHATRAGQYRSPNPMAPNFSSIATTLGMTDRALRVWLQSSHPTMPNLVLTNDERDDVVAYIMSLRTAH